MLLGQKPFGQWVSVELSLGPKPEAKSQRITENNCSKHALSDTCSQVTAKQSELQHHFHTCLTLSVFQINKTKSVNKPRLTSSNEKYLLTGTEAQQLQ